MNDEDIVDVRKSLYIEAEGMMGADGLNPQDLNAFQKESRLAKTCCRIY